MNASVLLFGILPLLAFVIIDSFAGLKHGILAAVLFAIAEAIYTISVYGTVDEITIASLLLSIVISIAAFR